MPLLLVLIFLKIALFCFECFACVCLCTISMPAVHGVQKRESYFLELELQMVVSYHVSGGNRTLVLCS